MLNLRWEQFPSELQQNYKVEEVRQPVKIILDRRILRYLVINYFNVNLPFGWWVIKSVICQRFLGVCQYIKLFPSNEHSYLENLLRYELAKRQINSLWLEAGETLAGAFIEENLVNELIIYMAPGVLGNKARGFCHFTTFEPFSRCTKVAIVIFGTNWRVKLNYQRHIL